MIAAVLGGALGVWDEYEALMAMAPVDVVIATNSAGRDFPGEFDHWVSFHAELFPHWLERRRRDGQPDPGRFWTINAKRPANDVPVTRVPNWGGSTGLVAVTVALQLGIERVVLCGVPLTREGEHYDKPGSWRDAPNYRKGFLSHMPEMGGKVRSFSGYTAEILGKPTREWINGPIGS